MGLFSRKKKTADPATSEATADEDLDATQEAASDENIVDEDTVDVPQESAPSHRSPLARRPHDRSDGPFDRSEVDGDLDGRLDFGSIAIVPEEGMELRLDVDENTQEITGLTAILGTSACQMQAFAAPKSSGIWDDIRDEIHDNLLDSGGSAEEVDGPLGVELHVGMPGQGPDGRPSVTPLRFVGVDGPRWFLRAVFSGTAASDEQAAAHMIEFVRRTVVVRGGEARAPRQMLPLKVPDSALAQFPDDEQQVAANEQEATDVADLNPFERGPEITEVR